jgi:hypothetical protein
MSLGLEVAFAGSHVFFPDGHLSRAGGTFDGTLAAAAIRDADPAAAPPEIRTLSGETLFVPAAQREELEQFCRACQIPVRKRPDIWGDLLEPFLDTLFTPEQEAVTLSRLRQAGLTDTAIGQIDYWRPMLIETPEPALAELLAAWEDFTVALRMRDGLSARAYERLRDALRACARSWEGRDSVPRLGANILVDIFPATEASADLYQGRSERESWRFHFICRTSSNNVSASADWAELGKNSGPPGVLSRHGGSTDGHPASGR